MGVTMGGYHYGRWVPLRAGTAMGGYHYGRCVPLRAVCTTTGGMYCYGWVLLRAGLQLDQLTDFAGHKQVVHSSVSNVWRHTVCTVQFVPGS